MSHAIEAIRSANSVGFETVLTLAFIKWSTSFAKLSSACGSGLSFPCPRSVARWNIVLGSIISSFSLGLSSSLAYHLNSR
ncbi:MAG: hypothetical protein BWX90_01297 [bacterium ADurb.Bin132]|nr:MAG: hypothetical protein BWX90_01297 [bacterium ADurb.Bin132]